MYTYITYVLSYVHFPVLCSSNTFLLLLLLLPLLLVLFLLQHTNVFTSPEDGPSNWLGNGMHTTLSSGIGVSYLIKELSQLSLQSEFSHVLKFLFSFVRDSPLSRRLPLQEQGSARLIHFTHADHQLRPQGGEHMLLQLEYYSTDNYDCSICRGDLACHELVKAGYLAAQILLLLLEERNACG